MINGDVQKQKQQRHQPPFSDAYLDGMPPKRRRVSRTNISSLSPYKKDVL